MNKFLYGLFILVQKLLSMHLVYFGVNEFETKRHSSSYIFIIPSCDYIYIAFFLLVYHLPHSIFAIIPFTVDNNFYYLSWKTFVALVIGPGQGKRHVDVSRSHVRCEVMRTSASAISRDGLRGLYLQQCEDVSEGRRLCFRVIL